MEGKGMDNQLTEEDLETIEIIAKNEQTGRITPWEIKQLVEAYRTLDAIMWAHGPGTLASDELFERATIALKGPAPK